MTRPPMCPPNDSRDEPAFGRRRSPEGDSVFSFIQRPRESNAPNISGLSPDKPPPGDSSRFLMGRRVSAEGASAVKPPL